MVLCVIAYHANGKGLCAFPDTPLICKEAKLSERAVRYALRDLEELGEISIETGRGKGHVTSYVINLPIEQEEETKGANVAPLVTQEKGQTTTQKGQSVPLSTEQKGQSTTAKGANGAAKGAKSVAHIGRTVLTVMNRNTHTCEPEPVAVLETPVSVWESVFTEKLGIFQTERISEAKISDLTVWRETLQMWWTNQYSKRSLTRIIEVYREKLATKKEGNSNGKGNQTKQPSHRETHNEREARKTLEYINSAFTPPGSDNGIDPEDADPAGITLDLARG